MPVMPCTYVAHASTSCFSSVLQFRRFVDSLHDICKRRVLLYALSSNAPELESSVKQLSSLAKSTIGCLSRHLPLKSSAPSFSCSVALIEENGCRPFSSLESGEELQVGRWHSHRETGKRRMQTNIGDSGNGYLDANVDWRGIWNDRTSHIPLPSELQGEKNVRSLVYFSDKSSWELASTFRRHFPNTHQLGIVATSTPFLTGRPFTLLRDGKPQSCGCVGLALYSSPEKTVVKPSGVLQLTGPLPVQRAGGNLIHELGESVPAQILTKAIQDHGISDAEAKDADFYIGFEDQPKEDFHPTLVRIIAGSPSHGSIALEEVPAPPFGSLIKFFYRPKSMPTHIPGVPLSKQSGVFLGAFVDDFVDYSVCEKAYPESLNRNDDGGLHTVYDKSFLVSTEHALVIATGTSDVTRPPWKCNIPGTLGGIQFPD